MAKSKRVKELVKYAFSKKNVKNMMKTAEKKCRQSQKLKSHRIGN
jgi:hypothetical protein